MQLCAQPERLAPVTTVEADERLDREGHVEDVLEEPRSVNTSCSSGDCRVGKSMSEDFGALEVVVELDVGSSTPNVISSFGSTSVKKKERLADLRTAELASRRER